MKVKEQKKQGVEMDEVSWWKTGVEGPMRGEEEEEE